MTIASPVQSCGEQCDEVTKWEPSAFLRLPLELRQTIYRLCLLFDYNVNIRATTTGYDYHVKSFVNVYYEKPIEMDPARLMRFPNRKAHKLIEWQRNSCLIRVSKQLHAEATPFLYSNKFMFDSWKNFYFFGTVCGLDNAKSLQDIRVPLPLLVNRHTPLGATSNNDESLTNWAMTGLTILKRSPNLRKITFTVPSNLYTQDLRVARHFCQIPDSCQVEIEPGDQLRTCRFSFTGMGYKLYEMAQEIEHLFVSKRWDLIETFPKRRKVVHDLSDDEE